jgi:hypothetical protein
VTAKDFRYGESVGKRSAGGGAADLTYAASNVVLLVLWVRLIVALN